MKYILTGLHASGKLEAADYLSKKGIRVAKFFTNCETIDYSKKLYEVLSTEEMNRIFENGAYVYFADADKNMSNNYETLSTSEFEQSDVIVLAPNQLNNIPVKAMPDKVCFVWMDCNQSERMGRHRTEKRQYNFTEREEIERSDLGDYVSKIYSMPNSSSIYFSNEDPQRVAALVEIMVKWPVVADVIIDNFKE
jgi:hypothetical protein